MSDYRIDRRDMDFVLFEQLGVDKLTEYDAFEDFDREMFEMMLTQAQKFATEILSPLNQEADRLGCSLSDGVVTVPEIFRAPYKQYCEAGWVAAANNPKYGGMGLPLSLVLGTMEMFVGACSSFVFYPGLTVSAGHLIETFGTKEMVKTYVEKMYTGQWSGTMCLTEPAAGSAVGDLTTSATPNDDGSFNIVGTKIFISAGDHDLTENIVHLVLARVKGDPAGTRGISLFVVPKYRINADGSVGESNDVITAGIEHKMGINACSTALLSFGENDACKGYLIGSRRKGINAMFQMMNEARLVTGLQGVALGNAAYQSALAYAKERVQGTAIENMKDENAPRVTIVNHADVKRMLAIQKAYGEGLRALILRTGYLMDLAKATDDEDEEATYEAEVSLLTPICKAFSTDMGFRMTELAIQTYGGYGYIKEYPVEQHMRDVKIASLYEGTNGIQAMDLLGRKLPAKSGMVFMKFMQRINLFVEKYKGHEVLGGAVKQLEAAKNVAGEAAFGFAAAGTADLEWPMLNAVPFLDMMGHVVVGHLLLEQAVLAQEKLAGGVKADSPDGVFYNNKIHTAKFFAINILPHVQANATAIAAKDRSALAIEF